MIEGATVVSDFVFGHKGWLIVILLILIETLFVIMLKHAKKEGNDISHVTEWFPYKFIAIIASVITVVLIIGIGDIIINFAPISFYTIGGVIIFFGANKLIANHINK